MFPKATDLGKKRSIIGLSGNTGSSEGLTCILNSETARQKRLSIPCYLVMIKR
jgi:hypothetical protein